MTREIPQNKREMMEETIVCQITYSPHEVSMGLPVGVEDGSTGVLLAGNRLIVDQWQVLTLLERCVKGSDWHNSPGGLDARCRPGVEREADSVLILNFLEIHGERCM